MAGSTASGYCPKAVAAVLGHGGIVDLTAGDKGYYCRVNLLEPLQGLHFAHAAGDRKIEDDGIEGQPFAELIRIHRDG